MDEGRRRRMKAYGRPVRTGEHGCTFCPSLLSLHNPPCTAYGTGRLHKVLLGCKIKQRERETQTRHSPPFHPENRHGTQQTGQVESQT